MIRFTVYGKPEPQGSVRAFLPRGTRRPVLTSDNRALKPWRQQVTAMALTAMEGRAPEPGPISLRVQFFFERPKSLGRKIVHKLTRPDLDKLVRGILDALTGVVFQDDAQVTTIEAGKVFGSPSRAEIAVLDGREHEGLLISHS